jgi:hypothetical protein
MDLGKKRVGVAENPRSGVGARGSSVKKAFHGAKEPVFRNLCDPPSKLIDSGNRPGFLEKGRSQDGRYTYLDGNGAAMGFCIYGDKLISAEIFIEQ